MLSRIMKKFNEAKLVKKIDHLPITLKVTIWYTSFLCILFLVLIIVSVIFLNLYSANLSEGEVTKVVHDMAVGTEPYNYFDEGVLLLIYDNEGQLIEGNFPDNLQLNATFEENNVRQITLNNSKYLYYDERIMTENHKGLWIRGILSINGLQNKITFSILLISILSPMILLFIAFVGYRIIKVAFRPVEQISQIALEIGKNNDLSKRITLADGKDEIHHMANTFNQMLNDLEEASFREKQFTSDVSHELRTPIAVILAESQYGERHIDTLEESQKSFQVITRQTKRMSKLVHQLLDISMMDRVQEVECKSVNLSETIKTLFLDYKILAQSQNILLLGDFEKDIYINANQELIHRLIDNLFSNAMKFTKSEIVLQLNSVDKDAILVIKDDGNGIAKENLTKIWERFYQVDPSRNKDKNTGFGLGLSIVKRIVELNNGQIQIISEVGSGTTFTIKFKKLNTAP